MSEQGPVQVMRDNDHVELGIGERPLSSFKIGRQKSNTRFSRQVLLVGRVTIDCRYLATARSKQARMPARPARKVQHACTGRNARRPSLNP